MSSPLMLCCVPAAAPALKHPARKQRHARRILWLSVSLGLAIVSCFASHETAGAAPDSPGSLSFIQSNFSVSEGAGRATISVSRTGGTDGRVSAVVTPAYVTTNNADYGLVPGSVDLDFATGSGTNFLVRDVTVQPDGRILICGRFTTYNGVTRNNVARLHPDGALDTSFNSGLGAGDVFAMALQPDGKVIVVGSVRSSDGASLAGIGRLNPDGSVDDTFSPGAGTGGYGVEDLAVQPDGKILIGGNFPTYDNVPRKSVARLNADGSLDGAFVPADINGVVNAVLPMPDGKAVVGGSFSQVDGAERLSVARLNADGSLDTTFSRDAAAERIFVLTLALQPDGKVLVGGSIYSNLTFSGASPTPLVRLNADGNSDPAFADPGLGRNYRVQAIAQQEDGKLLIGGSNKASVFADPFYFIQRLNTGGSIDPNFFPNVTAYSNSEIYSMALQSDGKIVLGGQFSQTPNPGPYAYLTRLNNDLFVAWEAGDGADKFVTLRINDDSFAEPDETSSLTLTPLRGGAATGALASATLTILDNEPVADDQAVTTDEDTPKPLTLAGSNPDGGSLTFNITSNPLHGTLSGSGANRTYTPVANYSGPDSFKFTVTKQDGGTSAETTVSITVNAVNDAPVNSVPGAQAISQNTQRVFSITNFNAITVSDVDAGASPVRVTLSATNGTLTLASVAGLTFVAGDGSGDAAMTFNGIIASINASLNVLVFQPTAGFSGAAGLQINTDDQGHSGSGGALSDTDSVAITVNPGGTLQFSGATFEANENGGTASLTVTRTGGSSGVASVSYTTSAGVAGTAAGGAACSAGVDYVNKSGILTWANNDAATRAITITICNDSLHESDETVNLTLTGVSGSAGAGAQTTAVLTIHDDDPVGGVIEFSQSTYTVAEGAGFRTVTVTRGGDTTLAVTVDYSTDDGSISAVSVPCSSTGGMALDRCDFTKALGTLQFAAGETQKTFQVLIDDDTYVEGTEVAALKLANPGGGAALGTRATATLEITDSVPEASGNAIDDDAKFVRQNYHDFLNREPDASGFQFWVNNITSCGSNQGCREVKRIDTSAAFFLSIEFQQTGFLVYRMYKAAYGDLHGKPVPLTLAEFLPDTQRIGRGVVVNAPGWEQALEANTAAFAGEFAARTRFTDAYAQALTPGQFVDALNANTAGALSQPERDALVNDLTNGNKTRAQVLRAVAEDADFDARERNRAFVLMQYFGYLRRNPDEAPEQGLTFDGYNFWLTKLNQFGGDFRAAEMVKAFITSTEYRARFGQP